MIEIVKEGSTDINKRELPKNVRQIGEVRGKTKVYIEDYITTFMKQISTRDDKPKVLILYGGCQKDGDVTSLFVNGAILAECCEQPQDELTVFKEDVWKEVNEKAGHFFGDSIVLGWVYIRYDLSDFADAPVVNTHKQFFRQKQQIYMEYSVAERIENLYLFENGNMALQSGYFVYYERNEAMQNYMITVKQDEPEEVKPEVDKATRKFRGIVQEKKEESHRKQTVGVLYGTSVAMLLIVTVIGVTMLNNYEKMQNMEKVLYDISAQMTDDGKAQEPGRVEVVTQDAALAGAQADTPNAGELSVTDTVMSQAVAAGDEVPKEADVGAVSVSENESVKETLLAAGAEKETQNPSAENTAQLPPAENTGLTSPAEQTATSEDPVIAAQENIAVGGSYCIEKGDTLAKISRKFYGNESMIDKICELNKIQDKNNIQYGVNIVLP